MAKERGAKTIPELDEALDFENIVVDDGTHIGKRMTKGSLKALLTIEGTEMEPLVGGTTSGTALVVPNGPAGEQRTAEVSSGKWYDFGSGPVEASADRRWKSYWNGTSWVLKDMGELPQSPKTSKVQEGNSEVVESGGVYNALNPFVEMPEEISFVLYGGDGLYSEAGNPRTSTNWICTQPIQISELGDEDYFIDGIQDSVNKRVLFYTASDTLHQSPLLVPIPSGATKHNFTTPSGYKEMLITPAVGSNVASQIPVYNSSFKIYKGGEPKVRSEMIKGSIDTPQMTGFRNDIDQLMTRPEFANYEGLGFPQYEKGADGDKYFDNGSKRIFTKLLGKWIPNSQSRFYPVIIPVDFGWDIGRRIMYQENGKAFIEGWKGLFEEKAKADYDRLTKYYVSPQGSNSNDGLTPETAVLTVEYAVGTLGARNVVLAPGFYGITNGARMGVIADNNVTTEPLIIRCINGKALMARAYLGNIYTWTANGDCYQTARTNVVNVVDLKNIDNDGHAGQPTKVTSIALCQSTPNSFYATSSTVYIHTFDGRVPDKDILLCFAETTGYVAGQNVPYVYMENVDVINQNGSNAFLIRNSTTVQYNTKVYLKNCFAPNNSMGNGIAIDNIKEAILEGCGGAYLYRDALNYHTSLLGAGYERMKVLEIDCYGYETGTKWSGEFSSNASTMHEGGIILRVNTSGRKASGGVFADVGAGIRSLNIGIEASDTTLNDCIRVEGADSKLWVISGVAYTNLPAGTSIKAENGATAYYDSKSVLLNPVSGNVVEM